MMRIQIALAVALLAVPLRADAQCAQARTVNVAATETSTGPYTSGDTFEATFQVWASGAESMGTTTFVVDFNNAALSFPATPTKGTDYEFVAYDGVRTLGGGGQATYNGEVRATSASTLAPFINLQSTTDPGGEGEAIPSTPTDAFSIRWTVVDPDAGFVIAPRSQQIYNGPGGATGCFDAGAIDGLEAAQTTVAGDAGWWLLSAPAGGLTINGLASRNYVQGYPGLGPTGLPNVLVGYDGTAFGTSQDPAVQISTGSGFFWYFYDQDFTTGAGTSTALPMPLAHAGASPMGVVEGGLLPDEVQIPLHASGDLWSFIGNPTATSLDVTQIAPVGGSIVSGSYLVWQDGPGVTGGGTYAFVSDLGNVIEPWQGVAVQNTDATALSIPVAARVLNPASGVTSNEVVLGLELSGLADDGEVVQDRAIRLLLDDRAALGDDALDVDKLAPLGAHYAVLSFTGEGDELLGQEAKPLGEEGVAANLAFEAAGADATYTLEWDLSRLPESLSVSLLDRKTGSTVDLRAEPSYTFRASPTRAARATPVMGPEPLSRGAFASETARFALALGRGLPVNTEETRGTQERLELALAPATPNPFRTATTFEYALPEAGHVDLVVYDLLGRIVTELVAGEQASGVHRVTFAPRDLASGVYVVRLEVGGEVLLRRVTLVR
ncbi:MAG: T9SS type A sorting domain-containing protein [Bacteroidota bacterium]